MKLPAHDKDVVRSTGISDSSRHCSKPALIDNRTSFAAQRRLIDIADKSFRQEQQRTLLRQVGRTSQMLTRQSGTREPRPALVQRVLTHGMFKQKVEKTDPKVAKILSYMRQNGIDVTSFEAALTSTDNAGDLNAWLQSNIKVSLDRIELLDKSPLAAAIPPRWVLDTDARSNAGGLPWVVVSSPQGSPSSSQEEDRIAPEALRETDFVVDISQPTFKLPSTGNREYPITSDTKSDVRTATMLSNAAMSVLGGTSTIVAPSKKLSSVRKTTGKNKGSFKTIREVADGYTAEERRRAPDHYLDRVVMHNPDISFTGEPYSMTGWQPGTNDANALMGYGSGLGGAKHPAGSKVGRFVVKERSGHFAHSLEGRASRKKRASEAPTTDPLMSASSSMPASSSASSSIEQQGKVDDASLMMVDGPTVLDQDEWDYGEWDYGEWDEETQEQADREDHEEYLRD